MKSRFTLAALAATLSIGALSAQLLGQPASLAQGGTPEATVEATMEATPAQGFQLFKLMEDGRPELAPLTTSREYTVGWSMNNDAYPFAVAINTGTDRAVADMKIKLIHADGKGEVQTQLDQVEDFITQKVDGIVVVALDANAIVPQVEAAAKAGIPFLTCFNDLGGAPVENYPGSVALLGVDEVEAGATAAREILKLLPDGGEVAIIEGAAGFQASVDRSAGFNKVLAENPKIRVVATQPGDWLRDKALSVAENLLLAHPDLDVIYTHDDSMSLGAVDALKNVGKLEQVKVFGIGGSKPGIEAIRKGEMYGTVFYSPVAAGYLCTKALIAHLEGMDLPDYILMPTPLVTTANVDKFEGEW